MFSVTCTTKVAKLGATDTYDIQEIFFFFFFYPPADGEK